MTDLHLGDLPSPVRDFFEATNGGDTERLLALMASDVTIDDVGRLVEGPAAVGAWNASNNIGVRNHFEIHGAHVDGDEQHVAFRLSGDGFNGEANAAFRTRDGLIERVRFYA